MRYQKPQIERVMLVGVLQEVIVPISIIATDGAQP
jgi:hypothetical protein